MEWQRLYLSLWPSVRFRKVATVPARSIGKPITKYPNMTTGWTIPVQMRDISATSPPLSYKIKEEETSASVVQMPCELTFELSNSAFYAEACQSYQTGTFYSPYFDLNRQESNTGLLKTQFICENDIQLNKTKIYSYYMHLVKYKKIILLQQIKKD